MRAAPDVQPFAAPAEFEAMIDYFLGDGDAFLTGMGIDVAKLPTEAEWLQAALADAEQPDDRKQRFYVAWRFQGQLVGHSSISHIEHGVSAHCHLHLWRADLRCSGLGSAFLAQSIDMYFERFGLKRIASEPYAENPGPKRALPGLGMRLVRRYRTTPTSTCLEQDVNRYEVERAARAALR